MKKWLISLILVLGVSHLRAENAVQQFDAEKDKMKATRLVLVEDADNEYAVLTYKDTHEKRKIRFIHYGNCCDFPIIEDSYFKNNKLIHFRESVVSSENIEAAINGQDVGEVTKDLDFENSQLVGWGGTTQAPERDSVEWQEEESRVLTRVRGAISTYADNKTYEEKM